MSAGPVLSFPVKDSTTLRFRKGAPCPRETAASLLISATSPYRWADDVDDTAFGAPFINSVCPLPHLSPIEPPASVRQPASFPISFIAFLCSPNTSLYATGFYLYIYIMLIFSFVLALSNPFACPSWLSRRVRSWGRRTSRTSETFLLTATTQCLPVLLYLVSCTPYHLLSLYCLYSHQGKKGLISQPVSSSTVSWHRIQHFCESHEPFRSRTYVCELAVGPRIVATEFLVVVCCSMLPCLPGFLSFRYYSSLFALM